MRTQQKAIFLALLLLLGIASTGLLAQNNGIKIGITKEKKEPPVALFQLDEVTITAGPNPALRIIDSVIQHRDDNNPDHLQSYTYGLYDKMVFTVDTTTHTSMDSVIRKSDLMVMETVSEVSFKSPDKKRQRVKAAKVAGMQEPVFLYLADRFQSVSFYDETVQVLGGSYASPIIRRGEKRYEYYLSSVQPREEDTLFVISFRPTENTTIDGLAGMMTVSSDGWALKEVTVSPAEQSALFTVEIQQQYEKIQGCWFPHQYEINLFFPKLAVTADKEALPLLAIGKSYLTDICINPPIDNKTFSELIVDIDDDAFVRDNDYWESHRVDSLSARTDATYRFLDSLTSGSDIFVRMLDFSSRLAEDMMIPVGPVDIDIGSMIRISGSRGFYLGLHLVTNDRFSRHIRLKAFGAYWTHMKGFDYGGEVDWLISRRYETEMGVRYAQKSLAIGEFSGFSEGVNPLAESEYKYLLYENVLARSNYAELYFNTRFARHFKAFLTLGSYNKNYIEQFYLHPSDTSMMTGPVRYTNAELRLRFAYKERFNSSVRGIHSLGTNYPVLWLSYMHSFKGILGGQYDYDRVKIQLGKDFKTLFYGTATVLLQMGYASEGCPVMETFDLIGTYAPFAVYSPGSFATMREEEFFSDRFVALFLCHDFHGCLWKPNSEWFQPKLSLITNIGWGDLRSADACPEKNFKTMEKGYFESGFVVKGLLSLPAVDLGAGAFYRYGPYAYHKFWSDFAFKVSITLSM